jgi:hypothetical protein
VAGFMGLNKKEGRQLEMEVVPHDTRLKLTRLIRQRCAHPEGPYQLVRTARFVNIANHVMRRPTLDLESDDWGEDYPHAAYAKIESERELIMRLATTVEVAEILGDYLQAGMLEQHAVNEILEEGNCGFKFRKQESYDDEISVSIEIKSLEDIGEPDLSDQHPNIRVLVNRMDRALNDKDHAGVLHASASIFETLAKDVVRNPNVENQTLASFFGAYRNASGLPDPVLDYIQQVYNDRNTEPLAGHGSMRPPEIDRREATVLAEITKAIVRSERKLSSPPTGRNRD